MNMTKTISERVMDRLRDEALKQKGSSMTTRPKEESAQLPRVSIDFKIPLWGIMGAIAVFFSGLITMYTQLARVADDVNEMKASIKVNNSETIKFARDQAVLEFRVQKLEQERTK